MPTPKWLYLKDCDQLGTYQLPPDKSHHLLKVLRLKTNSPLIIFNQSAQCFQAELRNNKSVEILAQLPLISSQKENTTIINIAQPIIQSQRMDFVIQKLTELGISEIQPIVTAKTKPFFNKASILKKKTHWESIAINACEQSQNPKLPTILNPINFDDYLKKSNATEVKIQLSLSKNSRSLNDISLNNATIIKCIVGPESGFTEEELEQGNQYNFQAIHLPFNILRSETASIAIATLIQFKQQT